MEAANPASRIDANHPSTQVPSASRRAHHHLGRRGCLDFSLRPVQPGDTARIRAFIENLSYSARYFRFGCGEPHFSDAQVRRLCDPDTSVRRFRGRPAQWRA